MSKYQLVASYYNSYSSGNKYERETVVEIPGVDLSTLQNIDRYMANRKESDVLMDLKKADPKYRGLTNLAIRYKKNKSSTPVYYRVISDNPEFVPCTEITEPKPYYFNGKFSKTLFVPSNPLFEQEKRVLLNLIEKRDVDGFTEMYPYNDSLTFLVERYLNSYHDTFDSEREDFEAIINEFSRYITFRKWIVEKEKNKNYYNNKYKNYEKQKTTSTPTKEIKNTPKETPRIKPASDNQDDNQITMFDFANENNIDLGVTYYTKRRR